MKLIILSNHPSDWALLNNPDNWFFKLPDNLFNWFNTSCESIAEVFWYFLANAINLSISSWEMMSLKLNFFKASCTTCSTCSVVAALPWFCLIWASSCLISTKAWSKRAESKLESSALFWAISFVVSSSSYATCVRSGSSVSPLASNAL